MIIKQSWKIITSPNIVITILLKARYFSTGGFFASRAGHNPSKGLEKHMKWKVNYLEWLSMEYRIKDKYLCVGPSLDPSGPSYRIADVNAPNNARAYN